MQRLRIALIAGATTITRQYKLCNYVIPTLMDTVQTPTSTPSPPCQPGQSPGDSEWYLTPLDTVDITQGEDIAHPSVSLSS